MMTIVFFIIYCNLKKYRNGRKIKSKKLSNLSKKMLDNENSFISYFEPLNSTSFNEDKRVTN